MGPSEPNPQAEPLVTVVMPVFNAGEFLHAAVRSVLEQTYGKWELLLVDDGSTDGCIESAADLLASDPRIKILRQANQGRAVALNTAADHAAGEFYVTVDADDLAYPTRLACQVAALLRHPGVAACFCGHDLMIGGRTVAPRMRHKTPAECRDDIELMRMPGHDPTAMYRTRIVREMRFHPALRIGAGFDFILRVGERYDMMVLGQCLYSYRAHPGSVTRVNYQRRQAFVAEVLRRASERRGKPAPPEAPERAEPRNQELDNNLVAHFMESALDLRSDGRPWAAVQTGLESVRLHPIDPAYYKAALYAIAPRWAIHAWRRRRRTALGAPVA
jgi:glycosyltransferase involved in cell wall biosynthesis